MYLHELDKNRYNNDFLQRVYNKHNGKETIRWDIVQSNIPESILEYVEDIWIGANYGRKEDGKGGMNMRDAKRPRFSQETIDKIIKANKGRIPPNKGKKASLETVEKIKKKRALQIISHSQKTKNKIGKGNKGKKRSQKEKDNLSIKIVQLDKNGDYIKTWKSGKEASEFLFISRGNIASVVNNNRSLAGGFKWMKESKYMENELIRSLLESDIEENVTFGSLLLASKDIPEEQREIYIKELLKKYLDNENLSMEVINNLIEAYSGLSSNSIKNRIKEL